MPVCLAGGAARMTGVGEGVTPVTGLPEAWLVLVNPGVAVATPEVFRALLHKDNPPMPAVLPQLRSVAALADFLVTQRNDLEAPAISLAPVIGRVLADLAALPGCHLARMSGSGATCFGLFADRSNAEAAADRLRAAQPGWWVAAAMTGQK